MDKFNYGVHAYAMLSGIMGPGIGSVRHLGAGVQHRLLVNWNDGRQAVLVVGKAENWLPFYATIVTERTLTQYQADSAKLYQALLEAVLPYLAGQADAPPMPIDDLVEPELCALVASRARGSGSPMRPRNAVKRWETSSRYRGAIWQTKDFDSALLRVSLHTEK